jgi:insulysin
MLFMGTEKYPDENGYSSYLSEHGGMSNAYTSTENTNYYFDVSHPYLEEVLDQFAQFFICPLFAEDATDREMKAVDSENAKNLQSDAWRSHQLYRSSARKEHPFSKFGTGNLETLDVQPKKAGIVVRDALLKFHETYYSANLSKLCVLGRQSLDDLEKIVVEKFSAIVNYDRVRPEWTKFGSAFGKDEMQRVVKVVPVKELREISVTWPAGALKEHYNEKPSRYLSHLIGHEGGGSLLSFLKAKGWANELSAGSMVNQTDFSSFGVSVDATDLGIEHYEEVVQAIFGYVRMLQAHGPQQWIFDECQAVNAMNFRFKSKEQPSSYCSNLAGNMHDYAEKDIISGAHLSRKYDPELIKRFLDDMTVEKVQVGVVTKTMEGKTDKVDRWYGTPYTCESIAAATLELWRTAPIDSQLHLPDRNDLIATEFDLVDPKDFALEDAGAGDPEKLPVVLKNAKAMRAFYKVDKVFSKPKLSMLLVS